MIETDEALGGRPLESGGPFPFRCHAGLTCFTACCRDKRLTLLPYDVLRLARALGLATGDFLAQHAELEIEPASGWPTVRIRLAVDGRCPFVAPSGCQVYSARPTCCRIYPLARAVGVDPEGATFERYVVDAKPERCLGFGAVADGTVEGWTRGQGLDESRQVNNRTARLLLDPRRPRPLGLAPAGVHAVVVALYNLDVFREQLGASGFTVPGDVTGELLARARTSDEALLEAGHAWLGERLFGGALGGGGWCRAGGRI